MILDDALFMTVARRSQLFQATGTQIIFNFLTIFFVDMVYYSLLDFTLLEKHRAAPLKMFRGGQETNS